MPWQIWCIPPPKRRGISFVARISMQFSTTAVGVGDDDPSKRHGISFVARISMQFSTTAVGVGAYDDPSKRRRISFIAQTDGFPCIFDV